MKILLRIVCAAALLLPGVRAAAEDLFILAGTVHTMTGEPLAPGAVHVSNGKIVKVGAKLTPPAGAKVIDLGSGVLLPGLIDAYSSVGIAGGPAETTREITPDYRVLTAVDWRSRAFREALADGTTCLGLAPGTDNVFAGLSCVVKTAGNRR